MHSRSIGRAIGLCAIVAGAFFAALVAVNVASAWTSPSGSPPSGSGAISVSSGYVGIGTSSVDTNYILTLAGGGVKADVGSTANPAGYFSNSGSGAAISVGSGTIVASLSGGITLGGVNKTAWPSPGTGTVTSIAAGAGLSGGTITTSGTISLNVATSNTWTAAQTFNNATATFGQGVSFPGSGIWNSSGNVGIGTTTLGSYKLSVAGTSNFTGKMTVSTVDPVYSIDGTNYATYLPAITGEKEETAGLFTLACAKGGPDAGVCSTTIDFNALPRGSDLWLFGKATNLPANLSNMIVILTPSFNGKTWYKKNVAAGTVTVYGEQAGEVSYRLTAPRFDAAQWPNTAPASEVANFVIK